MNGLNANQIQFASPHYLATGDAVLYQNGGGTNIGGSNGSLYNQVYQPEVSCE